MAKRTTSRKKKSAAQTKKSPGMYICLLIVAVAAWLISNAREHSSNGSAAQTTGLERVEIPSTLSSELIDYTGMTVSFNRDTHQPNYVVWELLASETSGTESRVDKFYADPSVKGCATPDDYRNTGYDRGHMAPAGDMKWDKEAMRESFLMTNICPQAGDLNRGAWNKLEEKCRQRAKTDSAIVIVAGPIFGKGGPVAHLGATGVAVPEAFFKVILSPYADPPVAIGFIMPNGTVKGGMQACAVTVDEVEDATGFDFFSALPDDIENDIESRVDFDRWSRLK